MQPPMPSLTPTWHNDTYPAISPDRPELSVGGKTVVITGAAGTVGSEAAKAFAEAGAKRVVLLARNHAAITKTAAELSNIEASAYEFDVTNAEQVQSVAKSIGTWDVLVMCAGYMSQAATIEKSDSDDWWKGFEVNVKGTYNTIRAFVPTANSSDAVMISLTSGGIMSPASMLTGLSSYAPSKLAMTNLIEFVGAENPLIRTLSVHPGFINSATFEKCGMDPSACPMDTPRLSAHFIVWAASSEARFLDGKTVWANWDVEELLGMKDKLQRGTFLTAGNFGFPYA